MTARARRRLGLRRNAVAGEGGQASTGLEESFDSLDTASNNRMRVPVLDGEPNRARRRGRVVLAVAVSAAVVSTGGLIASTWIRSPAQVAADSKPPPATLLTAPVTRKILATTVVFRGDVYPGRQYQITPAAVSPEVKQLVITGLPVKAGADLRSGQLVAEVSGQPLFVLRGRLPAYRDILPGSSGPDVTELQGALASLGYSTGGDVRGYYGANTQSAVAAFYRHLGYPVPTTGPSTAQAVDAAKAKVGADESAISRLENPPPSRNAKEPPPTVDTAALAEADKQLHSDQRALRDAQRVNGPEVPMSEVIFLPTAIAVLTATSGEVGDVVAAPLLTITTGHLDLTGLLNPSQASQIRAGMPVQILSENTNITARGTVSQVGLATTAAPTGDVVVIGGSTDGGSGDNDGGSGSSAGSGALFAPVRIATTRPLAASFSGQNVRITVQTASTKSAVLCVPSAAIVVTASGTAIVTVVKQGRRSNVAVTPGASADGYVQVTPTKPHQLSAAMSVVIGQ